MIGAPESWTGQKGNEALISWIKTDPHYHTLALLLFEPSCSRAIPQHRLPCPRARTDKTPGKGSSVDNPYPEFVERCAAYD